MNNDFIEYLKKQIGNKSLGQIEIQSGVPKSTISYVLRGLRDIPKPETLKKLAKALPCSYEELMENAGYIEKKEIPFNEKPKPNTITIMPRNGQKQEISLTDEQMQTLQNLVKYMGNNPDDLK